MKTAWIRALTLSLGSAATALAGCASEADEPNARVGLAAETALPARRGSVIVDGCVVDTWQRATLASPAARKVLREVVLLCGVPRDDGVVGPRDASSRAALAKVVSDLQSEGYRVHLGLAFTDETGQRYNGAQTARLLSDGAKRGTIVKTARELAAPFDGVEVDLQGLPDEAREDVTALVSALSADLRPAKSLAVFVPPSVSVPSDLPGGEAFSRGALAAQVDRLRVMTLDYSDRAPGPTIDPGWAVDAARLALAATPNVDVAYPLYGTDFGPRGTRAITYLEARAVAALGGLTVERGPTGAPFVRYTAFGAEPHVLWFDDAESTTRALGAWTYDALPREVGVVFYGLGAEDPALFDALAARTP
ncbi:MAG: hypothetical protein KC657_33650 [Myxococcales bacterium]|nr:hypothetical protein [Myxococcales bacterium]